MGYRPSLSTINERSNAVRRWNKLRQSVARQSQARRNARTDAARVNRALLKYVQQLNKAHEAVIKKHQAQMKRLLNQAVKLNALRDPNYLNAKNAAIEIYKKQLAALHPQRNKVVNNLLRNHNSSQIRRNLYANAMKRGEHGTTVNTFQNWTNKLWHRRAPSPPNSPRTPRRVSPRNNRPPMRDPPPGRNTASIARYLAAMGAI